MLLFFKTPENSILAVQTRKAIAAEDIDKLCWLFGNAELLQEQNIRGQFIGPRREMITPWSTNAVEITQNMGLDSVIRIEEFVPCTPDAVFDPMLQCKYDELNQDTFNITRQPEPILYIDDIDAYNKQEGLALSSDEIDYLNNVAKRYGRSLTDSEVFGFSQVNSEHCRHKIFNGTFVIDGEEKELSLFKLIKKTSQLNENDLVSAYKDNVAFNKGPEIEQFAPASSDKPDYFNTQRIKSVISLKAETHNFPTTVEPFNGAATGTGGEIRDRLGGGRASLPIAGTAVYMTPPPFPQKENLKPRPWLYQTPEQILIKASNGASDFGNKFGQPLICGSLLTFEHEENKRITAYDKVIMLAGGVGFAKQSDALKGDPKPGEKVVVLGGDNYRIGMGGGAVSSVETGQYGSGIELNAVQRANPEMQKRAANVIRALAESNNNPVVSIHDHGAGGHLNCLSELVEATGGHINMDALPIGDPTLSAKEIVGNESQERMGLLVKEEAIDMIYRIAERERSPMYVVGETTDDMRFTFEQKDGTKPIDMALDDFFGKAPKTYLHDKTVQMQYADFKTSQTDLQSYIEKVLQLEAVACKDWLTNKVDRSVTGKIARQQCQGELQLPLSDCGAVALDYRGTAGIATSIGHAPQAALIDPAAGSVLAVAESLTNIVLASLAKQLAGVSLSANWMWPCKNEGEDARLYKAVEACSDFVCALGINIPTGKDSLSMTQKYSDPYSGKSFKVLAPGTVIISAAAEVSDVKKIVGPVLQNDQQAPVYYIDFSCDTYKLGGSALAQALGYVGSACPTCTDPSYFAKAFNAIQNLVNKEIVLSGHDISAGGMITTLLEMCFANTCGGVKINLNDIPEKDIIKILFAENPGMLLQIKDTQTAERMLNDAGVSYFKIGTVIPQHTLEIDNFGTTQNITLDIDFLRDLWYKPSYKLDCRQSGEMCAVQRYENYKKQPLQFDFKPEFKGMFSQYGISFDRKTLSVSRPRAAIIREKGTNGEREMAYALYLAGFDVKDVHMTDLASGRETLDEVNMIVFCGGFSNSDVLGSAKGWAGAFLYNDKARAAITRFYARHDTLSLGICNGCQLMIELANSPNGDLQHISGLFGNAKMKHNKSHKFESSFVGLTIAENNSVLFGSLSGSRLGIWVAHGEGRFSLPDNKNNYGIAATYSYDAYPANPNGSDYNVAALYSADGRHVAMMPHLERAIFPWQWAFYPQERKNDDQITPWIEPFVNARKWIEGR